MTEQTPNTEQETENRHMTLRREKLQKLREQGPAFPNDFRVTHTAAALHADYQESRLDSLNDAVITVAGRIMTRRLMGKASFVHLKDRTGHIQLYVRASDLADGTYEAFKTWDLGDIIGVQGHLFKTKTGELSIACTQVRLLTKALRPLPDKFHGLTDQQMRYRQRYLDLLVNDRSKEILTIRTQLISYLRQFFIQKEFMEVETPMMHTLAGGASARPFTTHHHALNMELYLRIAPELYLKRLVVGGIERVFEINRNFRNEGVSTRHNPEFTMLEFYQSYADYLDLMDLTEDMLRGASQYLLGSTQFSCQGQSYDFNKPFDRLTLIEAIMKYNPGVSLDTLNNLDRARNMAAELSIPTPKHHGLGKVQLELFEKTVEPQLQYPTFITAYPAEVSPLARCNDNNPFLTDRFELFIGGREIANGFSELNDPEDQMARFQTQMNNRDAGDEETMPYDRDYITALEYGMPPTAGEGIGIDRLTMLFTDSDCIREVILFPLMRHGIPQP